MNNKKVLVKTYRNIWEWWWMGLGGIVGEWILGMGGLSDSGENGVRKNRDDFE